MKIGNINIGKQPLFLAPMEDITDPPFRRICKSFGADVLITEFISSEGLIRDAGKSLKKLDFDDQERPLGIQIFGHDVDSMKKAASMASEANPDFIDINFGCPVRKVVNKGGGAAALKDLSLMQKMTAEVVKSTHLPVTVKTRLGWDEQSKNIEEAAFRLQDCGIAALTIHGRTRSQFYKGTSDWTLIGKLANDPHINIPIIGNGDIDSGESAKSAFENFNPEGLMIGRAAMGNPWIFKQVKEYLSSGKQLPSPTVAERVQICKQHLQMEIEWKGERQAIMEMRKLYSGYFKSIPHFKPWRMKLVSIESAGEINNLLDEISFSIKDGNE